MYQFFVVIVLILSILSYRFYSLIEVLQLNDEHLSSPSSTSTSTTIRPSTTTATTTTTTNNNNIIGYTAMDICPTEYEFSSDSRGFQSIEGLYDKNGVLYVLG